jgi:xanthosine utilization system XapX-like protein
MVENADVDDPETRRLQAIVGKTFRKAKRWYLGYLGCQLAVLIFALLCVVVAVDPRVIAVVALIGVLATESVRWRSEFWKSQGELAKRRWELVDGRYCQHSFGNCTENTYGKNGIDSATTCVGKFLFRRKFLLNQSMQMLSYRWMIETSDHFVQKAGD